MQPYLFPYIGYYQLINAVEKFVVYDDIAFIKQGWINRNYILLNGVRHLFTIPVQSLSSYTLINETIVSQTPFNWQNKLLQTVIQSYKRAPFFNEVFPIIETVIAQSADKNIASVATESIESVMAYLAISTPIIKSSGIYRNSHLKNEDRVIDICIIENSNNYINAIGGMELYDRDHFTQKQIGLHFLRSTAEPYVQFDNEFINSLSVIDVLMFNPAEKIKVMLDQYKLI